MFCLAECATGFDGTGALAVCTEAGWDVNSDCTPVSTACVDSPPPGDNSEAFANCSNKALGEQCTAGTADNSTERSSEFQTVVWSRRLTLLLQAYTVQELKYAHWPVHETGGPSGCKACLMQLYCA